VSAAVLRQGKSSSYAGREPLLAFQPARRRVEAGETFAAALARDLEETSESKRNRRL
jgi:hypothetical protein